MRISDWSSDVCSSDLKSALPFRAAACGFADGSFCCEYRGPATMESERDDRGPSAELRQLMTRLSLANSKALSAVIGVDAALPEGWLAGPAPVQGSHMVMLRELACIPHGPALSAGRSEESHMGTAGIINGE